MKLRRSVQMCTSVIKHHMEVIGSRVRRRELGEAYATLCLEACRGAVQASDEVHAPLRWSPRQCCSLKAQRFCMYAAPRQRG